MHVAKRQLFQPAADYFTSFFLLPHYDFDLNDGLKHVEKECLLSHNYNFILFIAVLFFLYSRKSASDQHKDDSPGSQRA